MLSGLGGKGGPYRLDAGHDVHQLSDEEKNSVPEEVQRAAREMGKREFQKRLKEIQMSEYDSERYDSFVKGVSQQIASLKQARNLYYSVSFSFIHLHFTVHKV